MKLCYEIDEDWQGGVNEGIMRERASNLGDLKYVQIHDLAGSFNNSRVHCTYDLRLQIKQRGSFVNWFK